MIINSFTNEHRFLSNFYPSEILMDGKVYASVEHYYQAMKTSNDVDHEYIRTSPSPGKAKRRGKEITIRPDWENIKINVMINGVTQKFKNPELREKLLATKDAELIEQNYWNDTFWGICNGKGKNWLGIILMGVRSKLESQLIDFE